MVNLEEYKMGIPKRKNNISVYTEKELTERRQELLDKITKSDTYLPDSILHDDLDKGFLDYVTKNFQIVSDGNKIPIINKILTVQRWGEFTQTWTFTNDDGNIELPFVAIVRKPDVQPGTNPSVQRTIPDRHQFYYASVPTWNGTTMGADIYKIPQPVPVDITYDVTIVCNKFRDINKFSKIVLQNFSSRQDYTQVKGHYIPLILDKIEDNTPMDTLEGRRFYIQNYTFTMLGFLIDSEEFEVKPAINRFFLMNEFAKEGVGRKKYLSKVIDITVMSFTGDGMQTQFSVGESIGTLFSVTINGLLQEKDVDFYHISYTSKITFVQPPVEGSTIVISYYKGRNNVIIDNYGKLILLTTEYFQYDGSTLTFNTYNQISTIVSLDINGLQEEEGSGFDVSGPKQIVLLGAPVVGSRIGVTYLY
jgi:hypothetical protein